MKRAVRQLSELRKYGSRMRLAAEEWTEPWKTLIATILSARTRDEVTIHVTDKLFNTYPSVKALAHAKKKDVEKIIRPINFYKTKTKNIIGCARSLLEKYEGNPPQDFELLLSLPGVGRKTANVFLSERGKDEIGVDTHVSYISQKLGWITSNKPEVIEQELKQLFPEKKWREINPVLVRFGKTYTSKKRKDALLRKIKGSG